MHKRIKKLNEALSQAQNNNVLPILEYMQHTYWNGLLTGLCIGAFTGAGLLAIGYLFFG